jgi:Uma2 family endonuclease
MTVPVEKRRYTIAEYLAMEEKATDRHEFHDGEILAMSGGTYRHSRTNTNLLVALGTRLRGTPCEPLDSNMRVRITGRRSYLYPDISIVCGGPQFDIDDPKQTTITNPRIVVEVLSDSTELYDRGAKFSLYREIPSLQQYVLVSQHEPLVETYLRQAEGAWLLNPIKGIASSLLLPSVNLGIPLTEIYVGVEFEAAQGDAP